MSRYMVKQSRGSKSQRIGNAITMARIRKHLFGGETYHDKYEKWDKLEAKICRIPRIWNIKVIELTSNTITFKAYYSDGRNLMECYEKEYEEKDIFTWTF